MCVPDAIFRVNYKVGPRATARKKWLALGMLKIDIIRNDFEDLWMKC